MSQATYTAAVFRAVSDFYRFAVRLSPSELRMIAYAWQHDLPVTTVRDRIVDNRLGQARRVGQL